MDMLIGALITVCFFLCLFVAYSLGRRQRKADIADKLTQEEEEALKRQMKGLENVLNYDYDVAIGRRANK